MDQFRFKISEPGIIEGDLSRTVFKPSESDALSDIVPRLYISG